MLVKNLVNWAGPNWDHEAGQEIELDDATAVARCEAGVAEAPAEELEAARERMAAKPKRKAA
jgi:hypothetical protein